MGTARARGAVVRNRESHPGSLRSVDRKVHRATMASADPSASGSLRSTRGGPVVVKLGGRSLEAPGALDELSAELATLPDAVLVHGGGRDVSDWCARAGLESRFAGGLRVTANATLEVAVAVLAGLANKRLVARLRHTGLDAVGLAALDGIAECAPHENAATLGHVGRVLAIDAERLEDLIDDGRLPVLASIGASEGELLNLNADDLAAALAGAVGAETLVLLSDTPGVVLDGRTVETLDAAALERALEHPDVQGGMVAKLAAARAALAGGAAQVWIAAWSGPGTLSALLSGSGAGTRIAATSPAARRSPGETHAASAR